MKSQNPLQQTLGMGEGSDFSQRLHQAFLMQVMNQEALRSAAAANGNSNAAQAANAYNTAAQLAAAGGYNSQHWAAMLGMTGNHAAPSTANAGIHGSSPSFSIPKSNAPSPSQHASSPLLHHYFFDSFIL